VNELSRRGFLKQSIRFFWVIFPFACFLGKARVAFSAEKDPVPVPKGETPVSESDSVASVLGFHHDAKQTDLSRYPDRGKASSKNQFCKSCVQYTRLNEGWGKCNVVTAGVVSVQGWCGSWSKKP